MRNIGNLLKQAQAVQENMAKAQAELAQVTVTGESGGGMVRLQMNGRHEVSRVQIEAGLALDDREMLEDLFAAAVNDAVRKVDQAVQAKMQGMLGGLQLPPGMKLPF